MVEQETYAVEEEKQEKCKTVLKEITTYLTKIKRKKGLEPDTLEKIHRVEELLEIDLDNIQVKSMQELYNITGELAGDNEELSDVRDYFKNLFDFLEESPCSSPQP